MTTLDLYLNDVFSRSLLPAPDEYQLIDNQIIHVPLSTLQKLQYYATNTITGVASGLAKVIVKVTRLVTTITDFSLQLIAKRDKNLKDIGNHPPSKPQPPEEKIKKIIARWLPTSPNDYGVGISTSLFQDCGLGTLRSRPPLKGTCNWANFVEAYINRNAEDNRFINYLDNPKQLASYLKDLRATSVRLSLERSVIETAPGEFNKDAIYKYKKLLQTLKQNGIEPIVTLHHFVDPEWFMCKKRFENLEKVKSFVNYCLAMIGEFKNEVKWWITFNEPTIYVFQTYIRKVYPGTGHENILLAGKVLRNLLIAHIMIYRQKEKYGDIKIGFTHQWLKFVPYNLQNPIENIVCNYLSHITHYALYDFFLKQPDNKYRFAFQLPFISNFKLVVSDEERKGLTDFVGLQHYGWPIIIILGFNGGQPFPGRMVKNFTTPNLPIE